MTEPHTGRPENGRRGDPATNAIIALERIAAHEDIHVVLDREHTRELQLADAKFVTANGVREEITGERNLLATKEELQALREEFRREMATLKTETDRRASVIEQQTTTSAGVLAGRSAISAPLQGMLLFIIGALLVFGIEHIPFGSTSQPQIIYVTAPTPTPVVK